MKRLTGFILLLVISIPVNGLACYFYPYGEEIRFSIFNPDNFGYDGFRIYNYTTNYLYDDVNYVTDINSVTQNDLAWFEHCQGKIPIMEIKKAIFEDDITTVSSNSKNAFIRYLYTHKDFETIEYLRFAKDLERLNPDSDEIWEKKVNEPNKQRYGKIDEIFERIKNIHNPFLKKRYYYQIFKLLRFADDDKKIISLYKDYSQLYKTKDFLDNWILFYVLTAEKDDVKKNYLASQVFVRGTDDKFDIRWYFNRNIPIERVLEFAKNNEERANIYVLYSFKRIDQNLDNIIKVYQYHPNNRGLGFLLLREINKIEDWILTPTYTMFIPTLRDDYWENSNDKRIINRVEVDRAYASKVLTFVNSVDMNNIDNKEFWLLSKSYLEFLTKDYAKALKTIHSFENKIKVPKVKDQCDLIKALVLTANQEKGKARIPKAIEGLLISETNKVNFRFVFAIARELEILDDKPDAAFLISKIKEEVDGEGFYGGSNVYWKSRTGKIALYDDFYFDWYGYTDAELSSNDMQSLINTINSNNLSAFDQWKIKELKNERNKVNDLMGIKYMRDDNLKMAYYYFAKVNENHYTNGPLFNENPFYKIKGYMDFDPQKSNVKRTY